MQQQCNNDVDDDSSYADNARLLLWWVPIAARRQCQIAMVWFVLAMLVLLGWVAMGALMRCGGRGALR